VRRKFLGFLSFGVMVALLIVSLKVMNWLPTALQADSMRRYGSIEEVRKKLNFKGIYLPTYFPPNLIWPPSDVFAQARPFPAVVTEFQNTEKRDVALMISQAASPDFLPDKKIKMRRIKERVTYPLKGRNAVIEAGECGDDETCSRITWDEAGYRISVIAKSTPPELIKVAESMLH